MGSRSVWCQQVVLSHLAWLVYCLSTFQMSILSVSGICARHLENSTEQGLRAAATFPPERLPCPFSFEIFVNSNLCEGISLLLRSTRGVYLVVRSVGNCLRAVSWTLHADLLEGDGALTLSTPGAGRKGPGCVLGLPGGREDRGPGTPGHPSGECSARGEGLLEASLKRCMSWKPQL